MTHLSLFVSFCPRFLVFVLLFLYTKYCPKHMAHVIFSLHNILQDRCYHSHFTYKETEGPRGSIISPELLSEEVK